jgi:hypothetical protein
MKTFVLCIAIIVIGALVFLQLNPRVAAWLCAIALFLMAIEVVRFDNKLIKK